MFWFKRKKITVDCFIDNELIATHQPIQKASHFIPEWWKNLSHTVTFRNEKTGLEYERGTMRGCAGFIDLYKQGIIMPMWSDVKIEIIDSQYRYQFALNSCEITDHPPKQHNDNFKGKINIKLTSPWVLKEKTGVDFLFMGCSWTTTRLFSEMSLMPGVVNFKNQMSTHVNSFVPIGNPMYSIFIEAGTPLIQMIPISEKRVVPKIHVLTTDEYHNLCKGNLHNKFVKSYFSRLNKRFPT